jgi:hypothetical protein
MKSLLILLFVFSNSAFATDAKSETKPLELPDFSDVINHDQQAKKQKTAQVDAVVKCKTPDGRYLENNLQGEYCVPEAGLQLDHKGKSRASIPAVGNPELNVQF